MTLPFLCFLLTVIATGCCAAHALWRFVLREQDPSLVNAVWCLQGIHGAWVTLQKTEVTAWCPTIESGLWLLWASSALTVIVRYELKQPVPFDGLFPWWKGEGD